MHPSSSEMGKAYRKKEKKKNHLVYVNFNINTNQFHRFRALRSVSKNDKFLFKKENYKKMNT